MNLEELKGIIVPIVVPVNEDETINEDSLRKVVDHIIDGGANGILAFGSNSEFYMFDEEEMKQIFSIINDEVKSRVPVFWGIGAIRTSKAIKLAKLAQTMGAFGVSVLQPMFLKPTEKELYLHYKSIAESVPDMPVLIYNNPRVGYGLSAELVSKLAHNVENIVGMKDSSGNLTYLSEVIRLTKDIEFKPFTGKDTLIFLGLCAGACGSVCSTANGLTKEVVEIYRLFKEGKYKEAREAQMKFNPARLIQDKASFPVATKDMCNILGMDVGNPIKPSLPSEQALLDEMELRMKKLRE